MQGTAFLESHIIDIVKPSGMEGKEWDVVLIEAGRSKNGNNYSSTLLKANLHLFKDLKACAYHFGDRAPGQDFDHLPEQIADESGRLTRNTIGYYDNIRYGRFKRNDGTTGEGVLGKLHILEGAKWLRDNLKDLWRQGKIHLLGLSIDARGASDSKDNVKNLEIVVSTDVVSNAAAGGGFLRMVASEHLTLVHNSKVKDREPMWGSVDKTKLPKEAFAIVGDPELKSTWSFPHHWVDSDGVMWLHRGGVNAAFAAAQGARTGKKNPEALRHITPHRDRLQKLKEQVGANDMDEMLNLIKRCRPSWLEGFAEPESIEDKSDFLSRVIETSLVNAQEASEKIPISEVKNLSELDRGVKVLRMILNMMNEGKIEEAMAALKEWIERHAEPKSEALGHGKEYAYPYSTPNTIEPEKVTAEPERRRESMENPTQEIKPNEQDNPDLAKREAELATRENDLKVREKVLESGLPEKAQARVQQVLSGRPDVSEEDITKAIDSEREYIASFTESGDPKDLGDAHDDPGSGTDFRMTEDQREKINKAFDGMWANQDVDGVPRFTSLKTAFAVCNGGIAPAGWFNERKMAKVILESMFIAIPTEMDLEVDNPLVDPVVEHRNHLKENFKKIASNRLRESVTTSDFPIAFGDSLFRRLQKEYADDPNSDWRKIVSSIENLTDATNTFKVPRIGHPSKVLPVVNENAPYQELTDPTEESTDLTPAKHGGLLKFTWEDVLADRLGVLRQIPRKLARTGNRTIWEQVWDLINNNTVLTSDSVALIDTATHANRISGDPALSFSEVVNGVELLRRQTELDTLARLGLMPKFLLVSVVNEALAHEITQSDVKVTAGEDATVDNVVKTLWGLEPFVSNGLGRLTANENKWYITIDPRMGETISVGFLGGRDRPEMFVQGANTPTQGSFFDADAITFKSRLVFGVATVDFRWIVGSLTA